VLASYCPSLSQTIENNILINKIEKEKMGVKNRKKEREKGLFLSWERMKGNQKKKKSPSKTQSWVAETEAQEGAIPTFRFSHE